ncbi:MAG: mechanosensitive ion channel domain-containing protein [Rivularia sp. (in: cyanobacteria)]
MNDVQKAITNPEILIYLLIYLGTIIGTQLLYSLGIYLRQTRTNKRRFARGLPETILIHHAEKQSSRRFDVLIQNFLLLFSVFIVPFLLVSISETDSNINSADKSSLVLVFVLLLIWIFVNGTDLIKAFLNGLAFKTITAFTQPFQVGDRVNLKGIKGKVVKFNTFFVVLITPDDDLISIPTHSLWNEVLNSANSGNRSSLCVINFYLASFNTAEQRQAAEDTIWDAIQSSVYYEPSLPMQIYLSQTPDAIKLTAKAYVASTYNEPLFSSDVTRAFLDFASKANIALTPSTWEVGVEHSYVAKSRKA